MYLFELSRERDWFAPDRAGAGTPLMKYLFMIRHFRNSIIDARVPQDPALSVMDKVAVAGKADAVPTLTPGVQRDSSGALPSPQSIT